MTEFGNAFGFDVVDVKVFHLGLWVRSTKEHLRQSRQSQDNNTSIETSQQSHGYLSRLENSPNDDLPLLPRTGLSWNWRTGHCWREDSMRSAV